MKKQFQLTIHGKRELEEELKRLVDSRSDIADRIAEARSFGDLSENAEYSSAREEQGRVETRIAEIEEILAGAEIIEADKTDNIIGLGDTVVLKSGRTTTEYTIVGAVEADPASGKISNESPLGAQLMGKNVGDCVAIDAPKGKKSYEVVKIDG
ncbi:MAG: transcription elongation factor GreA [Candidatus Nomurabacteria bacterium]|jgi:transcription elongation factor GreA|nr:transcription elongation factor GreA [Candidatus Nomurabacteria bacterium]